MLALLLRPRARTISKRSAAAGPIETLKKCRQRGTGPVTPADGTVAANRKDARIAPGEAARHHAKADYLTRARFVASGQVWYRNRVSCKARQ